MTEDRNIKDYSVTFKLSHKDTFIIQQKEIDKRREKKKKQSKVVKSTLNTDPHQKKNKLITNDSKNLDMQKQKMV